MSNLRTKLSRLEMPPHVNVPVPVRVQARLSEPEPDLGHPLFRPHNSDPDPDLPPTPSSDKPSRLTALRAQMERLSKKLTAPRPRPSPHDPHEEDDSGARAHAFSLASSALPGEAVETADGPLRAKRHDFAPEHRHGVVPVAGALAAPAADLAVLALDPSLREVDFQRALYIDTETTGLAGGAGTLPFLIGMAWFEHGALCVEQLLLERPGLEAPMLVRLGERIRAASAIVSFNGKSFDWPLLRTRFVLTRVAAPPLPPHLDLLHCARRVYKRRLGSVRLVHLEEQVLGFTRVDDVQGQFIPETYLGYLRGQVPASALSPILEHNCSDLVALPALLGEIARRFAEVEPEQDARDQLGFAGVAARANSEHGSLRARLFAQGAAASDLRGELAPEAHLLDGELCLRAGDLSGAERALLQAIEVAMRASDPCALRAHLALAKLYEHRLKLYERALDHARAAAELEGEPASARRLARLTHKSAAAQPVLPAMETQTVLLACDPRASSAIGD